MLYSVKFSREPIKQFSTYSVEEYDRCNKELDPLAASAEWELERRVAGLTVFRAEVQNRTVYNTVLRNAV